MDLDLNEDQSAIESGIEAMLAKFRDNVPVGSASSFLASPELEATLRNSGFLDIGRQDGMGPLEASLLVEAVARLPYATEIAASAMIAPQLALGSLPRPLALARAPLTQPVRFLADAGAVIVDCGDVIRVLEAGTFRMETVKGPFAYPYGKIADADLQAAPVLGNVPPALLRQWWQVGLSFEIIGAAQAALDLTVQYVKDRKQFGKPIGTFQTVQHRLAECAAMIHGARLMARRAAWSRDPADAALCAGYCQDLATRVSYETHQFHGAIGLTLEYPLHLWSYRLRILQGEMGGAPAQFGEAADAAWPHSNAA